MKTLCVYCGSNTGQGSEYREAARRLGQSLVRNNLELVYGGAAVGLMGLLADATLEAGGRVIGVVPEAIAQRVAHRGLTELHIAGSMHERKKKMFDLSDAFIALPGGFGTLEELVEVLTWGQLAFHSKPCGVLNVCGYFDSFLAYLDHATREGFIQEAHRRMLFSAEDPETLLGLFRSYRAPQVEKWIGDRGLSAV